MRGKHDLIESGFANNGITPADAGKTLKGILIYGNYWDHPRGCGENAAVAVEKSDAAGSPPRMRGKHRNCRQYAYQHRITPADAGKTTIL